MTKEEVIDALGQPDSRRSRIETEHSPEHSSLENMASVAIAKALFDGWLENWEYGDSQFFGTSDEAHIIYFDQQGKVVQFRKPIDNKS